jgi:hypothetical protein
MNYLSKLPDLCGVGTLQCSSLKNKNKNPQISYTIVQYSVIGPSLKDLHNSGWPNTICAAFYLRQSFIDTYCPASNKTVFLGCVRGKMIYGRQTICPSLLFTFLIKKKSKFVLWCDYQRTNFDFFLLKKVKGGDGHVSALVLRC